MRRLPTTVLRKLMPHQRKRAQQTQPQLQPQLPPEQSAGEMPDDYVRRIGLESRAGWSYWTDSGQELGYVRMLPSGMSMKAVCEIAGHGARGECSMFLNIRDTMQQTNIELIAWLAAGRHVDSARAHKDLEVVV